MKKVKKESIINFRLSVEDYSKLILSARKNKLTVSKYIRSLLRKDDDIFTLDKDQLALLQKEFSNLVRLGSNIHQIARNMNYRDKLSDKEGQGYYLINREEILNLEKDLEVTRGIVVQLKTQLSQICKTHRVS